MAASIAEFDTGVVHHDGSVCQGTLAVVNDVFGGPCQLTHIRASNKNAGVEDVWLYLWDDTNPTFGTTAPKEIYKLYDGGGSAKEWSFPLPEPLDFEVGLSYAMTKTNSASPAALTTGGELSLVLKGAA